MARSFNFSAGPAGLPTEVLEQVRDELLDWHLGTSVMEMSHRHPKFLAVAEEAEQDLRDLMAIPDDYAVLFLHGGARTQFSMVPMNLMTTYRHAAYVHAGIWGDLALREAQKVGRTTLAYSSDEQDFTVVEGPEAWTVPEDIDYLHITSNETIHGVELKGDPDVGDVCLVSDMSSNILSRPVDVRRYGLIYACAQKNMGPAGVTVVIIRKDLIGSAPANTASMLNYQNHAKTHSTYNTSPTFPWYVTGLVFKWLKRQGGLATMASLNEEKARIVYEAIDASELYVNHVPSHCRSTMNATFQLADPDMTEQFIDEAESEGLVYLKGHARVGGIRASLYNAMPLAGAKALAEFMRHFESRA